MKRWTAEEDAFLRDDEFAELFERAERIVSRLDALEDNTVAKAASKQLCTLIRGAKRQHALQHHQAARKALAWAEIDE